MLKAAADALSQTLSPPFRATLWKVLALTLALLAAAWAGLEYLLVHYASAPAFVASYPWIATILSVVGGLGLLLGLVFLVVPISSLVAGFFLDDLAEIVERDIYPPDVRGRPLPAGQAAWLGARFALLSLAVNFCALLLFILPGVNALVFFIANAFLLGREYFELAALRFRPIETVRALRSRHALLIFASGLLIAAFVAIPIVNLLTPLFGVALMVRIHKMTAGAK